MKEKITLFVSILTLVGLLTLAFFASKQSKQSTPSDSLSLDVIDKTISVPNVLSINKCANWYVDFNTIKKTVIYSDNIISMGSYGGFVCLDYNSLALNENFTNKLNSDFYTNIACYNDTLFAEKFEEIFYLSEKDTTWVKYDNVLPVKFFDIIYQDDDYIFYPIDGGEGVSRLFIYDKEKKLTKGFNTDKCTNAIIITDGKYLISTSKRLKYVVSDLFTLQNIESMPALVDHSKDLSINKLEDYWNGIIEIDETDKSVYYNQEKSFPEGTNVSSTFLFKNNIYHFIENYATGRDFINEKNDMFLTKNKNGKITQLERRSTRFDIKYTNSYNGDYIFKTYGVGYMMLQKNNLIRIKFEPHASYDVNEDLVRESGSYETNITLFEKRVNKDSIVEILKSRDFGVEWHNTNYRINNKAFIRTEYSDTLINDSKLLFDNKILINYQGQEKRLIFDNTNGFLRCCFKSGGNDFLDFGEYGLIEITDLEKFVNVYSR